MLINLSLCDNENNNILSADAGLKCALDLRRYNLKLKLFMKEARNAVISGNLDGSILSISNGTHTIAVKVYITDGMISSRVHKYTITNFDVDDIVNKFLDESESKCYFMLLDLCSKYVSEIVSMNTLPMHKFTESGSWRMRIPRDLNLKYSIQSSYGYRVDKIKAMQILGIKKQPDVNYGIKVNDPVANNIIKSHKRLIVTD